MDDLALLDSILDGRLVAAGRAGYEAARRSKFARHSQLRPRAVVECASPSDVIRTIDFARKSGTRLVPRGGGHCFAGRSSTDGVVLDLGGLRGVEIDARGYATIEAGARLAQVYDALHDCGRILPAGCGPTVGIAGLALGGGLGLLGRRFGLTCDSLVGGRVVLADGRFVECDVDREPELYWALRGAGGGQFGVVTSLTFATAPEPRTTRFEVVWPEASTAAVLTAWQVWAPSAHPDITVSLSICAEPGQSLVVRAFGAALRDGRGAARLLDELLDCVDARPVVQLTDGWSVRDLKRSFASADELAGATLTTRTRSEFFTEPLPGRAATDLVDEICTDLTLDARRELGLTALGGCYDAMGQDETAYAHRGQRFLIEHVGQEADGWVDRSWDLAHQYGTGHVYTNFPDPSLEHPAQAYHGDNHARLVQIKRTYDPSRFFDFPQAV